MKTLKALVVVIGGCGWLMPVLSYVHPFIQEESSSVQFLLVLPFVLLAALVVTLFVTTMLNRS